MVIDIEPIIEKANVLDKIVLEYRKLDALYVVRTFENKDYSVKFDEKSIAEFQPNSTVSKMMKSWEANIDRRIKVLEKAVKTGRHPHIKEIVESPDEWVYENGKRKPKMILGKKNRKFEGTERQSFIESLERLKLDTGKLAFYKIVPTV